MSLSQLSRAKCLLSDASLLSVTTHKLLIQTKASTLHILYVWYQEHMSSKGVSNCVEQRLILIMALYGYGGFPL